jgi:subtilisin family serine protease
MSERSHGTHVASIAAGNRGVCREAEIAGVLLNLPTEDLDRRRSLYDSTSISLAVDYLLDLANKRQKKCVINVSLGTNGHAHDGSAAITRWIDAAMSIPGRAICVAAGNAGQDVAEFEGDTGYAFGRIHTSGRLASAGLATDIEWVVTGNAIIDLSENELELWFSPQDQIDVSIRPPGAAHFIGPVGPNQFIQNRQLEDGSFLSIYNELYHPANGANYISIYLSPRMTQNEPIIGVGAGTWVVRLKGRDIRDGRFHGWIERDDPRPLGRLGDRAAWNFPSFFSQRSNVDNTSVSSLACGNRVICVANYDRVRDRINISSSQGPTRDNRFKPDVAAPGTEIVAASGFTGPETLWVSMTGTSMASPFVTGLAGLMLAVEPRLTAAQIEGIIHRTAKPLPGANHEWSDSAGFGVIDPKACLAEAAIAMQRTEVAE